MIGSYLLCSRVFLRRVIILNGKEAILEAFLRQSEAFADKSKFWTETNVLNRKLRGLLIDLLSTRIYKARTIFRTS